MTKQKQIEEITTKVTRFEVIDHTRSLEDGGGRVFVKREENMTVELSLQDDGRTLKVFLSPKKSERRTNE